MHTAVGIRPLRKAKSSSRGENDPRPTVWFDSWRQLAGVISDENRQLLRLIDEHQPRTVMELATLSGRAASNLSHKGDEAFADKIQRLTAQLPAQMGLGAELDVAFNANLAQLRFSGE
jgi:hypothetical protein